MTVYSNLSVWLEGDRVRVTRVAYWEQHPYTRHEHLEENENHRLVWVEHEEGRRYTSVPRYLFAAWIDHCATA